MDLRVYHPTHVNCGLTVNSSHVTFDENGVSSELSKVDFDTLVSIPGFWKLEEWQQHCEAVSQGEFSALMADTARETAAFCGAVIAALGDMGALPPEGEAAEEDVVEHDPDASLYEQLGTCESRTEFYANLPLMQRLDLASDPRLTEEEAEFLFAVEDASKKSKRCLTALDRRLVLLRKSKSAESVTNALLRENFPRVEEV